LLIRSRTVRLVQLLPFLLMFFALPIGDAQPASQPKASALVHRTAPNFSRDDLSHKRINLTSYRGEVVLLNFWATWCAPCLTEMPTFREWQTQYGPEKFQVIGVSMDDASPEVVAMVARLKLNYPVLMGDEHLGAAYGGVLGLPVTFLIDRHGRIFGRYQGAADLPRIKSDIEKLLKLR
jgi:cytochrome c biogenesis protein CcmG/thiol:disulfide interchange protein DsbE